MQANVEVVVRQLHERLTARYGNRLANVVLYGSQARGDAQAGSDIDLLVVLRGSVQHGEEVSRTGDILAELSLQHNVVLTCLFVASDRYERREGPLMRNVHREGLLV